VQLTLDKAAPLEARVAARLDAHLSRDDPRPLALALSGGGDSLALLDLASAWARRNGRRVLALTVDHGLNPAGADWSRFAAQTAHAAGADWRGLEWTGDKLETGLPAAARLARHRLIAEAARAAGARVVLFAHTADDIAEADWMRARGSTLGRLRDWSPSPVWPEGRGLMLLRPLLDISRAALRDHLRARGLDWIEDPANHDPRFARSRARASLSLLPLGEGGSRSETDEGSADGQSDTADPHPPTRCASGPLSLSMGEGTLSLPRSANIHTLAAALVCAGGGAATPRGRRLARLLARLEDPAPFTATLAGARLEAAHDRLTLTRDPGEFARRPRLPLPLPVAVPTVWDGRYEITAVEPGRSVVPAAGRLAALAPPERAALKSLPPVARASLPVLIRDGGAAPVLAWRAAEVRSLVAMRLAMALDQTPHEADLDPALYGATPWNALFSRATDQGSAQPSAAPNDRGPNEPA
jgi:tRNA(Ile)-lysidine synthase